MINKPTERSIYSLPKMPLFSSSAILFANYVEDGLKKRCTYISEAF